MIGLGMGLLFLAVLQYRSALRKAEVGDDSFGKPSKAISLSFVGAIGVLLFGVFTLLNIFTGFGNF